MLLYFLSLGEGGGGARTSSSPLERRGKDGSRSGVESRRGKGEEEGTRGTATRTTRRRRTPRGPWSPFPRRRRDEGALASSSPISRRRRRDGLYKQLNINVTIINSLSLFIRTLTSVAQR